MLTTMGIPLQQTRCDVGYCYRKPTSMLLHGRNIVFISNAVSNDQHKIATQTWCTVSWQHVGSFKDEKQDT